MTSEYILEIHSAEDITGTDYLKAVVEKCLHALNNGEESSDGVKNTEEYFEVIAEEKIDEPDDKESVVNYINFDEYMVNEIVICGTNDDDNQPLSIKSEAQNSASGNGTSNEFSFLSINGNVKDENEGIESVRNDHVYHDIFEPGTENITIVDQAEVTIIQTNKRNPRKRIIKEYKGKTPKPKGKPKKKSYPIQEDTGSNVKKSTNKKKPKNDTKKVRKKKDQILKTSKPKTIKKMCELSQDKDKINKYPEVVKIEVDCPQANLTSSTSDPNFHKASKPVEGNHENTFSEAEMALVKGNYSIYDPNGKVILPFIPKRYDETMPFWCNECEFKTGTRQRLKLHKLRKHGGVKQFQCAECSYSAHDTYSVRVHYGNIHCKTKKFHCEHCSFACNYKSGLRKHLNKAHGDKRPFVCSKCGYEQFNITILKKHIQSVHLGIKPYPCPYCPNAFIDEKRLDLHVKRLHYRMKRYKCAKCDFYGFTKYEVKKHLFNQHMSLARVNCTLCNYTCRSNPELMTHHKKAHEKFPKAPGHFCRFCDFKTSLKGDLSIHMKSFHGIEKSFRCDLCDFEAFDYLPLKRHIKEHHNNDYLQCKCCNFKTLNRKTLREHKKSHTDKVSFPCRFCNANFKYKLCLTKHEVSKHGRLLSEEVHDDMNETYEKKWITYDQSVDENNVDVVSPEAAETVTYVGVNPVTNIELDKLIADTVADEPDIIISDAEDKQPYICSFCNLAIFDKNVFNWHLNQHDLEDKFKLMAATKSNFIPVANEEFLKIVGKKYTTCSLCGFSSCKSKLLILHLLLDHFNLRLSSSSNNLTHEQNVGSDVVSNLKCKLSGVLSDKTFCCSQCHFQTTIKDLYIKHIENNCLDDKNIDENSYVIPCEIIISEDLNNLDEMPKEVANSPNLAFTNDGNLDQKCLKVVPFKSLLARAPHKNNRRNRPYTRSSIKRTRDSSDDDDDVDCEDDDSKKLLTCYKCGFFCYKKRVMAFHFLNAHLTNQASVHLNDLKKSLSSKLCQNEPGDSSQENKRSVRVSNSKPSGTSVKQVKGKSGEFENKSPGKESKVKKTNTNTDSASLGKTDSELFDKNLSKSRLDDTKVKLKKWNENDAGISKLVLQEPDNSQNLVDPVLNIKYKFDVGISKIKNELLEKINNKSTSISNTFKASQNYNTISKSVDKSLPKISKSPNNSSQKALLHLHSNLPPNSKKKISGSHKSNSTKFKSKCGIFQLSSSEKEKILPPKKRKTVRKSSDALACNRCDVKMSSVEVLNMHSILAHGYSILLTCSYCCFTTSEENHLRRHIRHCFLLNS